MMSPSPESVDIFLSIALASNVIGTNALILTSMESPSKTPNTMSKINSTGENVLKVRLKVEG